MDHPYTGGDQRGVSKVVSRSKTLTFQMAEVAVPRKLFAAILDRIDRLRLVPGTGCVSGS